MSDNEKIARDIVNLCDGVGVGTDCLTLYKTNIQTAITAALAAKDQAMTGLVEVMQGLADMGNIGAQGALAKLRGET